MPTKKSDEHEIKEKDPEELELEKLVFGDEQGFEAGLRDLVECTSGEEDEEEADGQESNQEDIDLSQLQDDVLFMVDEGNLSSEQDDSDDAMDDSESSDSSFDTLDIHGGKAAWIDSDDEKLQISLLSSDRLRKLRKTPADDLISGREYTKRLRNRFEKLYPKPDWAMEKEDDESRDDRQDSDILMDSDDEDLKRPDPLAKLLQSKSRFTSQSKPKLLPPSQLDIARLKDANASAVSKSAVQTLDFHPTHPLLLTGGYDRTLRIYHVDGKVNPVATSIHIRESPFQTAQFHCDGKRVFAAGRRRYMYIWDIETEKVDTISRMYGHEQTQRSMEHFSLSPCGRFIGLIGASGWMNLLSTSSGQWIAGAKVEGVVADLAWHSDGNVVSIANTAGEIWEWHSGERKVMNKWKDYGGSATTRITVGGKGDRFTAVGGQNGIVSVYDRRNPVVTDGQDLETSIYKPKATIENLVTTVSSLKFSNDGQILAVASRAKKDALRLVHVPSFTVFKNWPTSGTPLGKVTSVAFTPGTQMFCTGNEAGHARLWRLNHYN